MSLHGRLTVAGSDLCPRLAELLAERYCYPIHAGLPSGEVGLRIDPLNEPLPSPPPWSDAPFFLHDSKGGLLLQRRGKTLVHLQPGTPWRLAYHRVGSWGGAVAQGLQLALRLLMARLGVVLLHGSLLAPEGVPLLIIAPRASGKSRLLLSMIHQGAAVLADDKMWLDKGEALRLQPTVELRNHHLVAFPWLADSIPRVAKWRRALALKEALRASLTGLLPSRLLPGDDRLLNPIRALLLEELVGVEGVLDHATPRGVVLLGGPGNGELHPVFREEVLASLRPGQSLVWHEVERLGHALALACPEARLDPLAPLVEALPNVPCWRLGIPEGCRSESLAPVLAGLAADLGREG